MVLSYARLFSVEQDFYNNGQGLSMKNCGGLSGRRERWDRLFGFYSFSR